MINQLVIRNVQSHKHTEFNFVPGINVISGSSNNGKTVAIRALNWIINNKPTGLSTICSDWNTDKNGNPIEDVSVTVATDKGVCSKTRGKNKNQYILNNSEYNAVGKDVPQQVKDYFGFDEVNLQSQMDSPFLLSLSGPDATKFINKVVKLDCIDSILSKAEKERRDVASEIKFAEAELNKNIQKKESLNWYETASNFYKKCVYYDSQIETLLRSKQSIESEIESYKEKEKLIVTENFDNIISEIESLTQTILKQQAEANSLASQISVIQQNKVYDFTEINKLIEESNSIDISKIELERKNLEEQINLYEIKKNKVVCLKNELNELKGRMPDTCPYCGSKL